MSLVIRSPLAHVWVKKMEKIIKHNQDWYWPKCILCITPRPIFKGNVVHMYLHSSVKFTTCNQRESHELEHFYLVAL